MLWHRKRHKGRNRLPAVTGNTGGIFAKDVYDVSLRVFKNLVNFSNSFEDCAIGTFALGDLYKITYTMQAIAVSGILSAVEVIGILHYISAGVG